MTRAIALAAALLLAGLPTKSCKEACDQVPPGVHVDGCPAPVPSPTTPPDPTPAPSAHPSPAATPTPCPFGAGLNGLCASPPAPTPAPTAAPTPQPTAPPTPTPTPTPCVQVALPPEPVKPARPPCKAGFEEGGGRCYAVADPDPRFFRVDLCRPCAELMELDVRGGHVVFEDDWPADPPRGYRDAYCRRTLDRVTMPHGDYGERGWLFWGACQPKAAATCPPTPAPTPTPGPGPEPSPGGGPAGCSNEAPEPSLLCNGEWTACDCSRYLVDKIGGPNILNVQRRSQIVPGAGSEANPAEVGDKVTMNSSPKFLTSGCVRGANIPGNCVAQEARFQNAFEWRVDPDVGIEPDGENFGYLAQFKATQPGDYVVTVCIRGTGTCSSNAKPIIVR